MPLEPWEYDESIFKSDEQQERERAESEKFEYVLWERVKLFGIEHYGVIIQISETDGVKSYLVESERSGGFANWEKKRGISKAEQLPPEEEIRFDGPYKLGSDIAWHGHTYRVEKVGNISEFESADAEDANDVDVPVGPYAVARLVR